MNTGWLIVGGAILAPFVIAALVSLVVSETARGVALVLLGAIAFGSILTAGIMALLVGLGLET